MGHQARYQRYKEEPCHLVVIVEHVQLLQAASTLDDDSERYSNMPAKLQEKLMGFQREGIKFALQRGGRLLVGDEMGLGKTVQAIGIMACYKDEWPCIIITPSSLRGRIAPPAEIMSRSIAEACMPGGDKG